MNEKLIEEYFVKNDLNLELVVDNYYNYISKIIKNNIFLNQEDEEEIISDVFFIVWKNKDKLDKKLSFSPYIVGITKKVIYKKYKLESKNISLVNEDDTYLDNYISNFNVEELIEKKDLNDFIIKNLKKNGDLDVEIFKKFYFEDKSINQISKETNLSKPNIKTKLHRIRKKVKEFLKNGGY